MSQESKKNYLASLKEYGEQLQAGDEGSRWDHSPLRAYLGVLLEEVSELQSPEKEEVFVERILGKSIQQHDKIRKAA